MFTVEGVPGEVSLAHLMTHADPELDAAIAVFQSAFTWWRRPELFSVAAVQGHAVGAGFQLALACDLRVVALDAEFSMRETSLGLVPDLAGTWPLVHCVGYARALEISVTGRSVGAEEAVRIGLAHACVQAEDLRLQARALLDTLLSAPPAAAAETKALLEGATRRDYDAQRAAERSAQVRRLRELSREQPGGSHGSRDMSTSRVLRGTEQGDSPA